MYQGATTTKSGNPKPKRKRRRPRKKNPSPLTIIFIAGGAAAVAGTGLAYWGYRRRKKAAIAGGTPGALPPSTGGTGKIDAPPFPFPADQVAGVEEAWTSTVVSNAGIAGAIPTDNSTIDDLTNDAFMQAYNIGIPPQSKRGAGWKPYIDSWMSLQSRIRKLVEYHNANVASA